MNDPKTQANAEKPKKKICCACPETKVGLHPVYSLCRSHKHMSHSSSSSPSSPYLQKVRDECVTLHGPESEQCQKLIEAHKQCLRAEGFDV